MPYMNITEVDSALTALSTTYPGTCELITLPNNSHEGRTIHAVRLGLGPLDSRPAIAFVGGQHAREWGSCEICINFASDLLEAYDLGTGLTYGGQSYSAATVERLIEDAQIFVYPLVNPDGRHYSQTTFAMWRKNRNPGGAVDLNRNYDILWDFETALHPSAGAVVSDNPSDDVYHGTAPFSEPETQNVRWLLDTYPQIRWLIDIHSYSELLYHVWGHDQNQITTPSQNFTNAAFDGQRGLEDDAYSEYITPADLGTQCGLVGRMQSALQAVRGMNYQTGQSFELYPTTGTLSDYPYSRHIADATKTKTHGFLIEWGTEFQPPWSEMENIILDISSALVAFADAALDECAVLNIVQETMSLQFIDVPEMETTFRAVVFRVTACCALDFDIVDGPTVTPPSAAGTAFGTPLGTSDSAPPAPGSFSHARLWVSYTGTSAGDTANGTLTVRCRQTNQEWVVPISTNVIERPTAAAVLVFDQSNSMSFDSGIGPGISRGDVLKFSAPPVVDVIDDGNALGIMAFDHDPHPVMPITEMDFASRIIANGHIGGYAHNPAGWTSIGEAVAFARDLLNGPTVTQTVKAMIVLTDGREQHDGFDRRYISDVADLIDSRVYAIGLGTPSALQPAALQALCDGHEGYMMMTGALDPSALFRLTKYYQQILAGVTNNEIVVDPEGALKPGQKHVIPFSLAETDITGDVILLSPLPTLFKFTLIAPSGEVIDPAIASANPAVDLGGGAQVRFYRMTLPVVVGGPGNHDGTWQAVLEIDRERWDKYFRRYDDVATSSAVGGQSTDLLKQMLTHGIRYSLMCRSWSNLRMSVKANQTSNEPGAIQTLRARLTEYGVPVENRANVTATVEAPDGSSSVLAFSEVDPGHFEAEMLLSQTGIYRYRVLAAGKTFRGTAFTREQVVTGAVWQGGDQPVPGGDQPDRPSGADGRDALCCLLACLLQTDWGRELLKKNGIPPEELEKCLRRCCDPQEPDHRKGRDGAPSRRFLAPR